MPEHALRIDVGTLRRVTDLLLNHLAEVVDDGIELNKDFFWTIDSAQRYDVYKDPTSFTVGQLTECWANIRDVDKSSATSYALVWLAELLRTIGEETVR